MGPLAGYKIVEIGGIGPAPFCGMMLADMGADVVLVERKSASSRQPGADGPSGMGECAIYNRGKKSIAIDLKSPDAADVVLRLVDGADALIEGFRPGVIERLGLGPDVCLARNPGLVFGRMTGWGQYGPLANAAGHDINYIALSGALYYSGHRNEAPFAPPTLVGDVGGGGMLLALGILAGILNARQTGKGQVIDSAITDGTALMSSLLMSLHQCGDWSNKRSDNLLDSASPWYDTYECSDGNYITVGAVEPKFYNMLLDKCGLADDPDFENQLDKDRWPSGKSTMASLFKTRARNEWCELMEGTDICFAPVLNFDEAAAHPHNRARNTFVELDGVLQAAPAPRFSETPTSINAPPPESGAGTNDILQALGFTKQEIAALKTSGTV